MEKVLHLNYASSLTALCEKNSSFDMGVLKIAYPGTNRNHTAISKETFERCMPSMYNCPVVCHYDRETDSFGGHDMELVCKEDGSMSLVNLTQPVGVIPEGAKTWWDFVEEDDGTKHEYLFSEVLLWKRQEAYQKIKNDGITAHSMELKVKDGEMVDGVFHIKDFEFTAFCLISVTPCFESSSLETFSKQDFKKMLSDMMADLKQSFAMVNTSDEVDDKQLNNSLKGGEEVLNNEKIQLAEKYGIDVESLDYSIEDFTIEELTQKFEVMKAEKEQEAVDTEPEQKEKEKFALTGAVVEEIRRVLCEVKVETEWGSCPQYCYVDCDFERSEVYCYDSKDWLLYGFAYSADGDNVTIDFDSKKRMKFEIVDFDNGSQESPFASVYADITNKYHEAAQFETKYNEAVASAEAIKSELDELRTYKQTVETEKKISAQNELFAKFEDLTGIDDFDRLSENRSDFELDVLEEKLYAIRGKFGTIAKFSLENKAPKLKVEKEDKSTEPYGGLFEKYGTKH